MGSGIGKHFQPEELAEFRNLPRYYNNVNIEIPERAANRASTDRKFLIAFILCIVVLIPFMIYTLSYSDLHRLFGYDTYGDICGRINVKYDGFEGTGKDVTNQRLLEFRGVNGTSLARATCVSECSAGYDEKSGYCINRTPDGGTDNPVNGYDGYRQRREIVDDLDSVRWRLIFACGASLGIGLTILFLFRVATAVLVWCILMGTITFLTIVVGTLWYYYDHIYESYNISFLGPAIIFSILLFILLCMVIFFQKRISLVIALFKETMKALFAMPLLLLVSVLVFIGLVLIAALFVTTTVYMSTAGILTKVDGVNLYYEYKFNIPMIIAITLNVCTVIWAVEFVEGVYCMIVSGAVSKWYFARNKAVLGNPIKKSTLNMLRYHLGTIAFGSLLMMIVIILRAILSVISKKRCCPTIERFLNFLTNNAYIVTAMHGQPFYKSGKRAVQIMIQNIVNIASIKFIGNFILFMAHVLVIVLSLLVGYLVFLGKEDSYLSNAFFLIVLYVSIVVAAICFSIFHIATSTIFLCFCEDCLLNDGMTRPYAMSPALMQFMDRSKRIFPMKKQ